jgi:methylmalonyl-CoA mutase N-terminal domain/subunit
VIAAESGVVNTVDPVAGSYAIETLTNRIEEGAQEVLTRIERAGGTLAAIESGLIQREIQESAYRAQLAVDAGQSVVVGVNRFTAEDPGAAMDTLSIDPDVERQQIERVRAVRASRSAQAWRSALDAVDQAARDGRNLVPPIIAAVEARATVGEIADRLRAVFGEYKETPSL